MHSDDKKLLIEEQAKDACTVCHGDNGGVPGNANIIDGAVMCDYCHASIMKSKVNLTISRSTLG